jgi:hypothetical protein
MSFFRNVFFITLYALTPGLLVHAQERVAGGNLNTEATWTALHNLAQQANSQSRVATIAATDAQTKANNMIQCATSGQLFDGSACRTIASTPKMSIVRASNTAFRWPSATATCPSGSLVMGGGGSCTSSIGWMFLNHSYPSGNSWVASCDTEKKVTASITVYAVCLSTN